jgi:putative transposase
VLQRPRESAQYTSGDFADALQDHDILASVGTTGDAYDNAMAESFVDTLKTELIADRRFRSRAQLELTLVKWVGWYNNQRLHEALGDIPPAEFEFAHQLQTLSSADLDERPCGPLLSTAGVADQNPDIT